MRLKSYLSPRLSNLDSSRKPRLRLRLRLQFFSELLFDHCRALLSVPIPQKQPWYYHSQNDNGDSNANGGLGPCAQSGGGRLRERRLCGSQARCVGWRREGRRRFYSQGRRNRNVDDCSRACSCQVHGQRPILAADTPIGHTEKIDEPGCCGRLVSGGVCGHATWFGDRVGRL